MRINGKVKWFNNERGYGFINKDGDADNDHFVHYSYIRMKGYKTLRADQPVTFELKKTEKGVHAYDVMPKKIYM
jgi:CspA family cold shock protein